MVGWLNSRLEKLNKDIQYKSATPMKMNRITNDDNKKIYLALKLINQINLLTSHL
jgi:hypothetical protein